MKTKVQRLLIADDHELVRQGVLNLLADPARWEICAEVNNGREAVAQAAKLQPDIAILDVSMPELNGLEATRQIRKACPQTAVLILTMHESESLVLEALAAGARGYLLKTDAARMLPAALEALADGKPYFTGKVSEVVLSGCLHPGEKRGKAVPATSRLTPREREIVQLLAEGRTNKEAATRLGVSVKTVDAHRANIMYKLDLHCAAELVRYAVREKIIEA